MDPETLTTGRLVLRAVGPQDTDAVYAACQDPDIQRWTTVPSPYLPEHACGFTERMVPEGWANETMFTFGVFLTGGELAGMAGVTIHAPGLGEIGYWSVEEHRGRGHLTEATVAIARWAFTRVGVDRLEWRAEAGNTASRAVALRAGFTMEGTLRSALDHRGVRRDCWIGSLLPSDLSLPSKAPYLPAPK
ncbi:GNAT family N-acetyltransferase [Streptomyces tagetis]|uniref:GNAT family N-acetyltransferase n=1 Tax=Streptomyces tagetis TaxID=2820809 RepID=A0A941B476_9ACTN|nr:GNAT family N-acetyltransferase [Streptomyces sp. RG38]MBQ0828942.1 GNAT family N-acetyltransferase [Streptomyces sp. RG38]